MSGFPPPSPPDKNLNNLYKSPFEDDSSSDKEKTSANKQTSSDQKTAQTKQNSWAAGNAQKTPSLQSKPSKTSLNLRQSALAAQPDGNPPQTHTLPIASPRIGARSQQQSASTTANSLPTQVPDDHQGAVALTSLLMNSASPVYIRTSSTVTSTTTTDTTSGPVNSTATTTTTRPVDSVTGDDGIQSGDKASKKERRLKKTEKQTGVSAASGAAINGAKLSPERMAKFLGRAVTKDGKFMPTQSEVKTFMRAGFGTVDGQSAQTCFAQFLHPIIDKSKFRDLYTKMALSLVEIEQDKSGNNNSLIKKVDDICRRDNLNSQNITSSVAVQQLLDPIVAPLFSYLNDVGDSIADSKLPAKLLQFMIEFDRELVQWYQESLEKSNSVNSANFLNKEEFTALRKNAQLALLGVKGIDGYLTVEVYKQLKDLRLQSDESTGSVLKNFNTYLSKTYSKNCHTFIDRVLSATDDDLKRIRGRRFEEEKDQLMEKAEKNFSQKKSSVKHRQPGDKSSTFKKEAISENNIKLSPRSDVRAVSGEESFSGKQLHQLEEKNEQIVDSFFDKYPTLNKFHVVISKIMKAIEAGYTKLGKSPSEKELQQIAVDAIAEEIRVVEDKIRISQTQTAHAEQTAIKADLEVLMGQILLATEHNPFDQ